MGERKEVEMTIAGLMTDQKSNSPVVILRDESGQVGLPIWIGMAEATAIASAIKKVPFPRPMTHDLICNAIEELGGTVSRIVINSLREHTFYASLEVRVGDSLHIIDSRPSDALAIAVRTGAPIFVSIAVLDQAKVTLTEEHEPSADQAATSDLPNFAEEDRDHWSELLENMDPEDFKYKM